MEINYFDTPEYRRKHGNFVPNLTGNALKDKMARREKEIINDKIAKYEKLIDEGNFGHAHMLRLELENKWGITADFESTFDPEQLRA